MAHPQQQEFVSLVKTEFPEFFDWKKILEVGSQDINGSVRQQFNDCDYTGIDVGAGPGVDVIAQGQEYDAPDGSFDATISCEVMEHNPYWKATFLNMIRMCRPGGLVLFTCASVGRPEHGTTRTTPKDSPLTVQWDYYRNLVARDFKREVSLSDYFSFWIFAEDHSFCDLFFAGFKGGAPAPKNARSRLAKIRLRYYSKNLSNWQTLRQRLLIAAVGEERYMAGPLRLRKSR